MKKFRKFVQIKFVKYAIKYIYLLIALLISAVSFNLFLNPLKIVSGGTNGISIILNTLFGLRPSLVIFIFCVVVEVFSLFILGFEKTSSALLCTFIYPLFVELTSGIVNIVDVVGIDGMLISIFAGLISGWSSGITCKLGLSSGGIIQISQMINKITKLSISKINFILNSIIVISGGYIFGITNMLYAIIVLYIGSLIIDKVLLGISNNKSFFIVTNKVDEVSNYILKDLKHGVTIFDVKGGYEEEKKKILMAVVPTFDYFKVTEGIKEIDTKAFFVVTDSYQVEGGK